MTVGYKSVGVDFDDLFDPDIIGDGPSAAGYSVAGVALRYAALSYGSKRANVGYSIAGVDVSNRWAAKGTAAYAVEGLDGKKLAASDGAITNQSTVMASGTVKILNDGTWTVSTATSQGAGTVPLPNNGTWLPAGATVSDYEVEFSVTSSGSGDRQVSNGAPAYSSASTSRTASLTLPSISANNSTARNAFGTVTIRLRRISTGAVSTSSVSITLSTSGWL